jgi:hypothetical protein
VRVHDLRFAHFAKLLAVVPASDSLQPHPVKDALASARRGLQNFAHTPMVRFASKTVNCPKVQVFLNEPARDGPAKLVRACRWP